MDRNSFISRSGPARVLMLSVVLSSLVSACGGDDSTRPAPALEAREILADVAHGVIVATYADLETRLNTLASTTTALRAAPTADNLGAARAAWRAARVPWEQSEGFLFGPVETQGLDPALDSWPVNTVDLDNVMASSEPLTPELVAGLEGTLQGFHTTEYLLFGAGGGRTAGSLTARELEYLAAAASAMRDAAARLHAAWAPTGGNFAGRLAAAGESGSPYVSQKAGLQELITGMSTIADEVANGKINDPFSTGDATLEESRFSANSIADFQDNLRSVRNIYAGSYGGATGHGVHEFVAGLDAELDTRFAAEIQAAIDAIGAIPPPFTTAITLHPAEVAAAREAVRRVQETLDADIAPLLENF